MKRRVTIEEFAGVLAGMPAEIKAAAVRGARSAAMRGVGFVVEEIEKTEPYPPVNTGAMRQSTRESPLVNGGRITVDAPHAVFMEYGTRPHMPPLAPLIEWAKRRLSLDDAQAQAVARAVQMKIAKYGTAPRHFFARAMKRVGAVLMDEIEHELNQLGK